MDFARAKILQERGDVDGAMQIYEKLLNQNFMDHNVMLNYGIALQQKGKFGLAANLFARIADLDAPAEMLAMALQGIGNSFRAECQYDQAEKMYRQALKIQETPEAWSNLGGLFSSNGTPDKAIECYERALALKPPNDKAVRFNLALMYLEKGWWDRAFPLYEECLEAVYTRRTYHNVPTWDGSHGKKVLFYGDQGVGDEIMFASCLPDAAKVCKGIIFDCHPRLVKTFKRSFPDFEVHGTRKNQMLDWLPNSGAEASECLSSMPRFFRKKNEDFPGKPYLKADPEKVAKLRSVSKAPRVGISWRGGVKQNRADRRSVKLEQLLPILDNDCEFYSLQYTPEGDVSMSKEVCELEEKHGIRVRHYPGLVECFDYDETINFIASMDLVISVTTTVIHAAGALGVPCWVLTPNKPGWVVGTSGEKMVWYDSVKLLRQKPDETWSPLIHRIGEMLADFCELQRTQQKAA